MMNFENKLIKTSIILFLCVFTSCKKEILIEGDVNNLPDGTIYLYSNIYSNILDSTRTIKGEFVFEQKMSNQIYEPVYLGLRHIDKLGVMRSISFPTNAHYKNSGYESEFFLSDSIIIINGNFKDNTPDGLGFGEKKRLVTSPKIVAGYQTNAMFHTDGDLFNDINKETYNKVLSIIKEYPNSFHLLYQINNNRNSFKPEQIDSFLYAFRGEITESNTFKNLKEFNKKRVDKKKLTIPLLLDNNGQKTEVLDTKFNKHLVIFWASWCGPCRQEIPSLKKMYSKYNNNIEFVSISIDEKNSLWQKALDKEQMSWKQLIVNEESKEFEPIEILFQLSPSIPYIVFLDNNMKVIKSQVGTMTEIEFKKFIEN